MELEALYLTQGSLPLNAFLLWQASVREENSSVVSLCFLLNVGTMSILCFKFCYKNKTNCPSHEIHVFMQCVYVHVCVCVKTEKRMAV